MKGYLVPHPPLIVEGIGKGNEIPSTRRAMQQIAKEIQQQKPDTIIIISPHSPAYSDCFSVALDAHAEGDFGKFGVKQIGFTVTYDQEFARTICEIAGANGVATWQERYAELDHGVMVPLHFIKHSQIVRVSLSGLSVRDHYAFGTCIATASKQLGRNFVIVASGDMSHTLKADGPYGFTKEGPQFDELVRSCVEKGDAKRLMQIDTVLIENASECGYKSLVMLLGAFEGLKIRSQLLSYEGPFGVGYLTAKFESDGVSESLLEELELDSENTIVRLRANESEYVRLARQSVEYFTHTGKVLPMPKDLPKDFLDTRAGVFVSMKKDGGLRGCIGTIAPAQKNLAAEIIQNAVSACSQDPRFSPVKAYELDQIIYSVDVLAPAEEISSPAELDTQRYGVIVRCGRRSGLLLPALPGVDTVEEQIGIALRKAGIDADEPYTLERFEVVRHI